MQQKRSNGIYLLVGRRETGKTTYTKSLLSVYPQKKLIIDMFSHPSYEEYPRITIDLLKSWKNGTYRLYGYDIAEILAALQQIDSNGNRAIRNCLIVFEDSKRYIESNVPAELKQLIIEHRNRNIDIVFQFHNLVDIPPYIAAMHNKMVLFKCNTNFSKRLEKFSNWDEISQTYFKKIQNHKNPYHKEVITLQ